MSSLLEVCVDSYASAMAALRGGADRLELCSCLPLGGLSPSPALLKQLKAETDIPIYCLIRSRAGDFLYSEKEIALMCLEIEILSLSSIAHPLHIPYSLLLGLRMLTGRLYGCTLLCLLLCNKADYVTLLDCCHGKIHGC